MPNQIKMQNSNPTVKYFAQGILAILLISFGFAINWTYQIYKGTNLSRHPNVQALPAGYPPSDAPVSTATPVSGDSTQPVAPVGRNIKSLKLYPKIQKGMRTPFDLWGYYGRGVTSFGAPILPMRFEQWLEFHRKQKPQLMNDVRNYMNGRFEFSGKAIDGQVMSGGRKPIMAGPIARLPKGVASFEELGQMSPEEILEKDLFPYKPLAHPLQSNAHMLFPESWLKAHPEARSQGVTLHGAPQAISRDKTAMLYLDDHRHKRGWYASHLVHCDLQTGQLKRFGTSGISPITNGERVNKTENGFLFTHAFFTQDDERSIAMGHWPEIWPSATILLVDVASGDVLKNSEPEFQTITSAAKAIAAPRFATAHLQENQIRVWTANELKLEYELPTSNNPTESLALSPNGKLLAAIDSRGSVQLWNIERGVSQTLGSHGAKGSTVLFSRDGCRLVSSADDQTIREWNIENVDWSSRPPTTTLPAADSLAFAPNGEFFAILENESVKVWDARTGKGKHQREIPFARNLGFSAKGNLMVVSRPPRSDRNKKESQSLNIIDLENPTSSRKVEVPQPRPPSMPARFGSAMNGSSQVHGSASPIGLSRRGSVAALIRPGYIQQFNWNHPEQTHSLSNVQWNALTGNMRTQGFDSVAINGDGSLIAGTTRNWLLVQRCQTGQTLLRVEISKAFEKSTSLSFAVDGSMILCQSDDWARVFDVRSGKEIIHLEDLSEATWFANTATQLLLGRLNGEVASFDLSNEGETLLFSNDEPVEKLCVDEEGTIAVLGGSGAVSIFVPNSLEKQRQSQWHRLTDRDFAAVEPGEVIPSGVPFAQWRDEFRTFIRAREATLQRRSRQQPPRDFEVIKYESDGRRLDAWLYEPAAAKAPLPGLVFLHGGFVMDAESTDQVRHIATDRFVILAPAMRGENGTGGDYEMMFGEVDDAREAARWLAKQASVNPRRIYVFGHSIGGGVSALLTLVNNVPIQHTGSCGGIYPDRIFDEWINQIPFDDTPAERAVRLLVGNESRMLRSHFAFLGEEDPLSETANIQTKGTRLAVESVPGDHFSSFEESLKRYLRLIIESKDF